MISLCENLFRLLLFASFFFLGLSLLRTYGDAIINYVIMLSSRSTPVTVFVSLTAVTVFALWIRKRQEIKKRRIEALDGNITDLKERLYEAERSLTEEELLISSFMDLQVSSIQRILENQREQFTLDLEDVQTQMEQVRDQLRLLEGNISECEERNETDKTDKHLREKQQQLNVQRKLERKKEKLEQLQLNTERVLQSTEAEGLKIRMKRKRHLKNNIKQLNERLEEEKKEREKLQQAWILSV